MEDEGRKAHHLRNSGRKSQLKRKRPIPSSASPKTDEEEEEEEEEEEMEDGSDDGSWEYVLESLRSKLRSTSAAIGTEAVTEAPGSPYFVDLSEYPTNTDIYSEQHWDWEKNCCVARVPRWARREYAEMNAINPTTPNASGLEGTVTPKKKQPRMVARLK